MGGWGHIRRTAGLCGLAAFVAVVVPSFANAAWLGYKNNTIAVIVVQASDVVIVNGQVKQTRPGKAHTLYPGEVAWDPITAPGPRLLAVYDPKQNNRLVYQDRVDCNKNDIFLSVQLIQPPQLPGRPPQPVQIVMLPTVLPAQAPGILPPGSMPQRPTPPGATPPAMPPGSRPPANPATPSPPPSSVPTTVPNPKPPGR
jgi:hypothetical protein